MPRRRLCLQARPAAWRLRRAFHIKLSRDQECISGEGGALIVNDPAMARRAEVLWEKGTNRSLHAKEVDKYTWVDIGSSFLPSEVTAAFLLAQLEMAEEITCTRQKIWTRYQNEFAPVANHVRLPAPPADCEPNGHIFYLVLPNRIQRDAFITGMKARISPLHFTMCRFIPARPAKNSADRRRNCRTPNLQVKAWFDCPYFRHCRKPSSQKSSLPLLQHCRS